jgi:hypothetical protein
MIKIRLEKWERTIEMQVLEQSEDLRGREYIYSNKYGRICSVGLPSLGWGFTVDIYIRGKHRDEDFKVAHAVFESNKQRDKYYDQILKVFDGYNNREKKEEEGTIFILK